MDSDMQYTYLQNLHLVINDLTTIKVLNNFSMYCVLFMQQKLERGYLDLEIDRICIKPRYHILGCELTLEGSC